MAPHYVLRIRKGDEVIWEWPITVAGKDKQASDSFAWSVAEGMAEFRKSSRVDAFDPDVTIDLDKL